MICHARSRAGWHRGRLEERAAYVGVDGSSGRLVQAPLRKTNRGRQTEPRHRAASRCPVSCSWSAARNPRVTSPHLQWRHTRPRLLRSKRQIPNRIYARAAALVAVVVVAVVVLVVTAGGPTTKFPFSSLGASGISGTSQPPSPPTPPELPAREPSHRGRTSSWPRPGSRRVRSGGTVRPTGSMTSSGRTPTARK